MDSHLCRQRTWWSTIGTRKLSSHSHFHCPRCQATRSSAALSTLAVAASLADEAADAHPALHGALMSSASLLAPVFQVQQLRSPAVCETQITFCLGQQAIKAS